MPVETTIADQTNKRTLHQLRRWWAIAGLVLITATWRLWLPPSEFPQVPLVGGLNDVSGVVDWICGFIVISSLMAAAVCPTWSPYVTCLARWKRASRFWRPATAWITFATAMSLLCLLNQQRLQPWAVQLLLMSMLFAASASEEVCLKWLRWLTISIYFWSAISKLDTHFINSHGQTLAAALLNVIGIDVPSPTVRWLFAGTLPICELLVAIGLATRRFRMQSLFVAIGLHLLLLLTLGPLGLQHRPGVLSWNVAFIGHVWLLFRVPPDYLVAKRDMLMRSVGEAPTNRHTGEVVEKLWRDAPRRRTIVSIVLALALGLPGLERLGFVDRWPAWAVYSARGERVTVTLSELGQGRLPKSATRVLAGGELPLDRWSLEALDAPIYPQLRFQLAVVEWLRRRCGDDSIVEVTLQTSTTSAKMPLVTERLTLDEWQQRRASFWLNSLPRRDGQ